MARHGIAQGWVKSTECSLPFPPYIIRTLVSKQIVAQLPKHYLSFPSPPLHTIELTRFLGFSNGLGC
jgi:hypothetical protein